MSKWCRRMDILRYMCLAEVAELLPTAEGFFFGRNEYDQYYLEDIKETIDIINNILDDTDFEEYTIAYCSSW